MSGSMGEKPRILAVDDEPRGIELAARTLRRLADVETATSGEAAWELFGRADYDLVLSDERMPGMTGVELLVRVARARPDVGRVLLTGYADIAASVDAINLAHVHAYLQKPCSPEQLRMTIEGVLERVRLGRDNTALLSALEGKNAELEDKNEALEEILASLRAAQQAAVEAERLAAIGTLAATIVHDFRGPLSVIGATARELATPAAIAQAETSQLAGRIADESARLTRMCAELADSTRVFAGSPRRVLEDLDGVVESALAALSPAASVAGVVIETALHSGVRLSIDEDRFRRMLLNLGFNAIEAMPNGGTLRLASERAGDRVLLCVSDTGTGIPDEIRDRIFEPFVTAGKLKGTGLGLPIAKKVVGEHDGQIEVGKPEGGGTVFRLSFRLPEAS